MGFQFERKKIIHQQRDIEKEEVQNNNFFIFSVDAEGDSNPQTHPSGYASATQYNKILEFFFFLNTYRIKGVHRNTVSFQKYQRIRNIYVEVAAVA